MFRTLDRVKTFSKLRLGSLSMRTLELISKLPGIANDLASLKEIYLILSIDTESDVHTQKSRTAGWEVGVPYILDLLSHHGLDGKACWLIEFNVRDGLVFANPHSGPWFVAAYEDLVKEMAIKRHEFGLHPTVYDWDNERWDYERPKKDPVFVAQVIREGTDTLHSITKQKPVGCRTTNFWFAAGLAKALEANGYLIDSSSRNGFLHRIIAPNAWFASESDYRLQASTESKTNVLEIPTTEFLRAGWWGAFSLKYKPNMVKINYSHVLFLSAFFHNWDAVTEDGKQDPAFGEAFERFINQALEQNVRVVGFSEAYNIYKSMKDNHQFPSQLSM